MITFKKRKCDFMNRTEIKKVLNDLAADINNTADKKVASILNTLVNLVEILVEKNSELEQKNKNLQDEVNRLKGEQGKPNIRKQSKNDNDDTNDTDHSSEDDRKKRQETLARKSKIKKKK